VPSGRFSHAALVLFLTRQLDQSLAFKFNGVMLSLTVAAFQKLVSGGPHAEAGQVGGLGDDGDGEDMMMMMVVVVVVRMMI
jgi:hypothetical protein